MTVEFSPLRAVRAPLTLGLAMLACAGAQAGDGDAPRWSFGGYGTLGFAHSNDSQSDFTANVLNPGNAGASHEWSATVDSRAGVQLGVSLDSRWSAVLQVLSERTLQSGYAPQVEWANVKYQATPDLSLRLGRIALPLFLAGDYRKAGYALAWVRPPVEVYGAIPISNSDGVDGSYRWSAAGVNNVTQVFFGHTDIVVAPRTHATARAMTGLSNTATSGALTVRASAMTTELTLGVARALFDGLRQFGPQGAALAARYGVEAKRADVVSLGASYDPGAWFLMGEVGRMNARSFLGDKSAAYVSGGYRLGDLTPYLAYAASRANTPTHTAGLDLHGLPPMLAGAGFQLNAGLNQMLDTIPQQRSATAGLRWDLCASHALKLQYDRYTPRQGSNGTFVNVQPGFQSGHPIGVVSASVDFVF